MGLLVTVLTKETYFGSQTDKKFNMHFWLSFLIVHSNKIRKAQNELLNIICQIWAICNYEFNTNFLILGGLLHLHFDRVANIKKKNNKGGKFEFTSLLSYCYCINLLKSHERKCNISPYHQSHLFCRAARSLALVLLG